MTTVENLIQTVCGWVETVAPGRQCVIQNDVGPTPPAKYTMVHFSILDTKDWDTVSTSEDGLTETVRGQCIVTIAISAIGGTDSREVANRLRNSLHASARWEDLWTIMGKGATGDLIDLTSEFRGKLRPRHEFTLSGETALFDDFNSDYFDQMDVTTKVSDLEETFTIGTDIPPANQDLTGC